MAEKTVKLSVNKVWKYLWKSREKYTCLKCGGIISIHDRECSECQEKMK